MAGESFRPTSLEHLVEFIKNPVNDVDHMQIYKNNVYLGSLLPKLKGLNLSYSDEQVTMVLYIKDDENMLYEATVVINNLNEYGFQYV
jgi:hypothetical protein